MTSDLLQKEEEFHKLNAELEQQTKALLCEVDTVMKKQTILAQEAKQDCKKIMCRLTGSKSKTKQCNIPNENNCWENYENNNKRPVSVVPLCVKARVTALQNELDETNLQYKNKCNEFKQLQGEWSKLAEEKCKWNHILQTQKDQNEKCLNQNTILTSKLQTKEIEMTALKKENESLKKDLKSSSQNTCCIDLKMNKLLEENEKLKAKLKNAKKEEKDIRDAFRKEVNELTASNKRLEKQASELTNGFKKQMMLIDNLKKQKMYLESAKLIQISEDEFSRVLEWNPCEKNF